MKKVPSYIKSKLQSYANHTQKAEKCRREIEAWVLSNGIDTNIDGGDIDGHIIADIIIDTGIYGNVDEAIILLEKILKEAIEDVQIPF